jgi:DNA-binding transcriptional MerR regulator
MGFTIKELETLSGIKAHTIRIWEQRYRFLKPSRTPTNIRSYSNDELKTLLTVALLNKHGYKISYIDTMRPEQRNNEVLSLNTPEAKNEYLVNELIGCMIELDIAKFENLLDEHIRQHTIKTSITTIVFSFLEKIGILWQTGRINPAHEHIVSNIIRQKLVSAIDALPFPEKKSPLVLLLLPENEHHELGLLFVSYLLKQRGIPGIYLGSNVPLKDAKYVVEIKEPQYVYIHLSSMPSKQSMHKFISGITLSYPDVNIIISGQIIQSLKSSDFSNVVTLQSLSQVISYISQL